MQSAQTVLTVPKEFSQSPWRLQPQCLDVFHRLNPNCNCKPVVIGFGAGQVGTVFVLTS